MSGLAVRLIPRGGRDGVAGERNGAVLIRIAAPPVDGEANTALIAFVAKALGVPKGAVRIVRGETSRDKVLVIDGVDAADARATLLALA